MKFENAAIVMTDTDTGKPYARQLSAWELNLVLSQLQALDGGALKAREIAPFILRTPGVTLEEAERMVSTVPPAITDLIGKRVSVKVGRVTHGTGKIPGGVQQIAKPQPKIKPVEAEVLEAARQPWQKHCEHKEHYHGRCQVCGKEVKP